MERDGTVAAAAHPLHHRVVHVLLVPEVVGHVSRDEVVLGNKREKSTAPQRVSEK